MTASPVRITLGLIASWVVGLFLLVSGFGWAFSGALVAGVAFLVAGAILLPPVHALVRERGGVDLSVGVRIAIVIVLVIIAAKAAATHEPWYQSADDVDTGVAANVPIRVCPGGERVPAGTPCLDG